MIGSGSPIRIDGPMHWLKETQSFSETEQRALKTSGPAQIIRCKSNIFGPGSVHPHDGKDYIFAGVQLLGKPINFDAATWKALQVQFLRLKLVRKPLPSACLPKPGVAIRLQDSKEVFYLLICFECREIGIARVSDQRFFGWHDFEPVQAPVLSIVKKTFPNDKEIQAIGNQ